MAAVKILNTAYYTMYNNFLSQVDINILVAIAGPVIF